MSRTSLAVRQPAHDLVQRLDVHGARGQCDWTTGAFTPPAVLSTDAPWLSLPVVAGRRRETARAVSEDRSGPLEDAFGCAAVRGVGVDRGHLELRQPDADRAFAAENLWVELPIAEERHNLFLADQQPAITRA